MEKQPVDDLFARKLREADVSVGPDVFIRLQNRMGTPSVPIPARRSKAIWWYAAACVVVAMAFVYLANRPVRPTGETMTVKPIRAGSQRRLLNQLTDTAIAKGITRSVKQNKPTAKLIQPISRAESQVSKATTPKLEVDEPTQEKRTVIQSGEPSTELAVGNQPKVEQPDPVKMVAPALVTQLAVDPATTPKTPVERTIVMVIEDPQPKTELATVTYATESQPKVNSLSGLFGKLRQLKNGDVFAKATIVAPRNEQRSRFSRALNGVKESLKNETTID